MNKPIALITKVKTISICALLALKPVYAVADNPSETETRLEQQIHSARPQGLNLQQLVAEDYVYAAQIGPLKAGFLDISLWASALNFEILGRFESSVALSRFYTWNGTFASAGRWGAAAPETDGYFVKSESSDDRLKLVVMGKHDVRRLKGRERSFETLARPEGADLVSALFFTPGCYQGDLVNDGEDTFRISLLSQSQESIRQRSGLYSGPTLRCEYRVRDRKGRKRRVVIQMAELDGRAVAVRVRVKVALIPDPMLRLIIG